MGFGMINWADALRKKQELQKQQANADTSRAQTARMAAESQMTLTPSQIAQNEASAAVNRARAAGMPDLTAAEVRASDARAGLSMANTEQTQVATEAMRLQPSADLLAGGGVLWSNTPATAFADAASVAARRALGGRTSTTSASPAPILPATGATRRGALSTITDENGIKVSKGFGFM